MNFMIQIHHQAAKLADELDFISNCIEKTILKNAAFLYHYHIGNFFVLKQGGNKIKITKIMNNSK